MTTHREVTMAINLVVRNIDEDIALALKQLAASHGRSGALRRLISNHTT
ncbi:MAG: FitA-like ribbon-helix-helix domain-containing protein [Sulfuriferula sp.]